MAKAHDKIKARGVTLNRRTFRALKYAEKLAGFGFGARLAQGSWNNSVSASAGTHSRGGALDIGLRGWSAKKRIKMMHSMKKAGFAIWFRRKVDGWNGDHAHALDIGDSTMHASAKTQVRAYDNRRDGLRGNKKDNTYRTPKKVWFSYSQNKPVTR
jgi:hypothetical protein